MKKLEITLAFMFYLGLTILFAQETESITDYDGNSYQTVRYGDYLWMVENLKVTHFNDGTAIPSREELTAAPGSNEDFAVYYKYPNNNTANVANYGLLYSWNVAFEHEGNPPTNPTPKNLCPQGWSIPSRTIWATLGTVNYSGDYMTIAEIPSTFNVQYAGDFNTGGFTQFGTQARFWTTELMMPGTGYGCKYLYIASSLPTTVSQSNYRNNNCQSIRCVKPVTVNTSIVPENNDLGSISLNSRDGIITLNRKITEETIVRIYDVLGKLIIKIKMSEDTLNIPIDTFQAGIYYVLMVSEVRSITRKIILIK